MFVKIVLTILLISITSINAQRVSIISHYDGSVYNSSNNTQFSNFTVVPCPFGYYAAGNGSCVSLGVCGIIFGQCKCSNGYDWLCRCSCNIIEVINPSNITSNNTIITKPSPIRFPFRIPLSFSPKLSASAFATVAFLIAFILS